MLKRNLFFVFSLFIVGLASLFICVNNYDPFTATLYQYIFFYISFFFTILTLASIIIFYIKIGKSKSEVIYKNFWPSVRQGTLLSLGISSILVLKGTQLFDIWIAIPIVIIVILLELFFQTKK